MVLRSLAVMLSLGWVGRGFELACGDLPYLLESNAPLFPGKIGPEITSASQSRTTQNWGAVSPPTFQDGCLAAERVASTSSYLAHVCLCCLRSVFFAFLCSFRCGIFHCEDAARSPRCWGQEESNLGRGKRWQLGRVMCVQCSGDLHT